MVELTPVATLDRLHAKHALPGFTDRSAEEREIERQTQDITLVGDFCSADSRTFVNAQSSCRRSCRRGVRRGQRSSRRRMSNGDWHRKCKRHPRTFGKSSACTCKVRVGGLSDLRTARTRDQEQGSVGCERGHHAERYRLAGCPGRGRRGIPLAAAVAVDAEQRDAGD